LPARLDMLAATYAAFAEGWTDPVHHVARRPPPEEAMFLARLGTECRTTEAWGLLALMLHANHGVARGTASGEYVPLAEQDSELWDVR
jgi:RNA polymerase sigma-70 factor (ECF subfamily)